MTTKTCNECKSAFPATTEYFYKYHVPKDGLTNRCKECMKRRAREWHSQNKSRSKAKNREWHAANTERRSAYNALYRAKTAEARKKRKRKWYEANAEHARAYAVAYASAHPEKRKENRRRYSVINREAERLRCRLRKRKVRLATPPWANHDAIKAIHHEALARKSRGEDVHVDHIIPLTGKDVCGLHVETNLRIVPAIENLKKKNKFSEQHLYDLGVTASKIMQGE